MHSQTKKNPLQQPSTPALGEIRRRQPNTNEYSVEKDS